MSNEGEVARSRADQGQQDKAMTMAEIRKRKTGVSKSTTIQIDGDISNEIEALRLMLGEAKSYDRKHNEPDTAPAIEAELDEVLARAKETEVTFTFRSIGRLAYDDLLGAHPPTEEQKAEMKKLGIPEPQYNIDTFPPALVAASCISPTMTYGEAFEVFNGDTQWNGAELQDLFMTANAVNTEVADLPLSRAATGQMQDLLSSLTSVANAESRTPSS